SRSTSSGMTPERIRLCCPFWYREHPMSLESSADEKPGKHPGPELEPRVEPRRKVRVLFINDTARNGGPGRSLFYILRFLEPSIVHRAVVLPRPGVISELYE